MKRTIIIVLIISFLTGCGGANNTPSPTPEPTATSAPTEAPTPEPTEAPTPEPTAITEEKAVVSVSSSTGMIMVNDQIPKDLREELHAEDQIFIQHIISKDADSISSMLRPSSGTSKSDLVQMVDVYSEYLTDRNTHYLEEYLFSTEAQGVGSNVMSPSPNYPFLVYAPAETGYVAISLILIEQGAKNMLLTIVRMRAADKWEIFSTFINDYSYYGMNAVDLYEQAFKLHSEGKLLASMMYLIPAARVARPSMNMQYNDEKIMQSFAINLEKEILETYTFPQPVPGYEDIMIVGLHVETTSDGLMPVIMYEGNYDVLDTSSSNTQAMEDEAHIIHDTVMSLYKDLQSDFDMFLYRIYNEYPYEANIPVQGYAVLVTEE